MTFKPSPAAAIVSSFSAAPSGVSSPVSAATGIDVISSSDGLVGASIEGGRESGVNQVPLSRLGREVA